MDQFAGDLDYQVSYELTDKLKIDHLVYMLSGGKRRAPSMGYHLISHKSNKVLFIMPKCDCSTIYAVNKKNNVLFLEKI